MKKITGILLAFLIMLLMLSFPAGAFFDSGSVTGELLSKIYYMENLDEGTVFFEKNSLEKTPAAGFIKVIASLVALESWETLDEAVVLTEKNLNLFEYEYGMTTAVYKAGEKVSRRELFDCLLVYSANDALSVVAYEIAGSEAAFIERMQQLVNKIGCKNTVVKNIHGFDEEGQYTTAQDVAKIIKYALTYPAFAEAFSSDEIKLKKTQLNEERIYYSSNQMLNVAVADYYHSSVTGGKQTSTELAGECIAVVSSADGYSYLTVVMQGKMTDIDDDYYDENTSMTDAQRMLDWVYDNIRYKVIVSAEQPIATVPVVAGKDIDTLTLVAEKETSALVPSKASPSSVMFEFSAGSVNSITAPVKAGEIVGVADVYFAGQKLTTINVVASEEVKLSFSGLFTEGLKAIIGSMPFLVLAIIGFICAAAYFVYCLMEFIYNRDPEKRKIWLKKKAQLKRKFKKKKKGKKKTGNPPPRKRPEQGKKKEPGKDSPTQARPDENKSDINKTKTKRKNEPDEKSRVKKKRD